jgi:Domain of unknown function (DUF6285)
MHGVPSARELAAALRVFLAAEVMPATEGRMSFMARVASNVAAQIERELELGPELARAHAARLAALGVADDAALAAAIRAGALDTRLPELIGALRASTTDRLRIANPRHLDPADRS